MGVQQDKVWPNRAAAALLLGWTMALTACTVSAATPLAPQFRVRADAAGKYWLIDPQGKQFLSLGLNNVRPQPWRPTPGSQYYDPVPTLFKGDVQAWKADVFDIFRQHGFNTVGAWSDGRLYDGPLVGTICLYVAGYARERCLDGLRPGFDGRVKENIAIMLADYPHTDTVFGVFLDNEMPWYGHAPWGDIPNYTLLELALSLPQEDPARQAAVDFLKQRYTTPDALSAAWGKPLASWDELTFEYARSGLTPAAQKDRAEFVGLAAEAFYAAAGRVVREMLPGKLLLGTRFAEIAPEPVIRACGRHSDIISFNHYTRNPQANTELLARYWIWGGQKPLMVTEYSWRGEENTSGNPNSGGAGAVVKTQAERAENYSRYVEDLLSYPMVVGAHWFEFSDQSPQGRFDGENSNYGIVDIHHRPYKELLAAMKNTNTRIEKLHAESPRTAPQALPAPRQVVFEAGQYPGRPATVDLLKTAPAAAPGLFSAPDAKIDLKTVSGTLTIVMDTGGEWGCGVNFFGPKDFANPAGPEFSTNLGGYSAIELDAAVRADVVFDLFLDEAGVAPPDAAAYDTSGGDDGEGFRIPAIQGKGSRHLYRFELKDLQPRTDWGNQKGLRKVDINSIKGIVLFFHGGQGNAQIQVYSLKLAR
jgi:agarase